MVEETRVYETLLLNDDMYIDWTKTKLDMRRHPKSVCYAEKFARMMLNFVRRSAGKTDLGKQIDLSTMAC